MVLIVNALLRHFVVYVRYYALFVELKVKFSVIFLYYRSRNITQDIQNCKTVLFINVA
jgi:hypothetical protein